MNEVLRVIENHPYGINFNALAELTAPHVSRSTLEKWLDTFVSFGVIERERGRRGQRSMIKSSGSYRNWVDAQENYEITLGVYGNKLSELKAESAKRKFRSTDYYTLYRLQVDICRLPFDSYMTGMRYSQQVANYLRDAVDVQIKLMYHELANILAQQQNHHDLDHIHIFEQVQTIVDLSARLQLAAKDKQNIGLNMLRTTLSTARRRLNVLLGEMT